MHICFISTVTENKFLKCFFFRFLDEHRFVFFCSSCACVCMCRCLTYIDSEEARYQLL